MTHDTSLSSAHPAFLKKPYPYTCDTILHYNLDFAQPSGISIGGNCLNLLELGIVGFYRQGCSLAGERTKAETAYEFKQKLVEQMNSIEKKSNRKRLLLSSQNDIEALTNVYQATLFTQNNIQKNDIRKALKAWKHDRDPSVGFDDSVSIITQGDMIQSDFPYLKVF